jgi:hypothetical protein
MDTAALVSRLKDMFFMERKNNLVVDSFGLAPAYRGFITDSYILGVSAPSLRHLDCFKKMEVIINAMFANLTEDERGFIDRVRVYDNAEDLKRYKEYDFEELACGVREGSTRELTTQLYEMA